MPVHSTAVLPLLTLLLLPPTLCFGEVLNTDKLQAWCAADVHCAAEYFMDAEPGLFGHMISESLVRAAGSVINTPDNRELWVARMRLSKLDTGPNCDVYQTPSYDAANRVVECVCLPESPCTAASTDPTLMYVVIILVVIIVVGILALAISHVVTLQRVAGRATRATPEQTRRMLMRILGT